MRFTYLPASLTFCAVVAVAACTAKSDTKADTAAAIADTTTAAATVPPPAPAAASSTAPITKININTATDAQILAIPGIGPRMLKEFKEYRPYTSIEQFRREMGKYVDKAEVARLEQYITIN